MNHHPWFELFFFLLFFLSFVAVPLTLVLFLDVSLDVVLVVLVEGLTNFLATSAYENDVRLGVRVKGIEVEEEDGDTVEDD